MATTTSRTTGQVMDEVGPAARPWAGAWSAGMMRVYLRTVPWVWVATAVAGSLTWQAATDRAEDYVSVPGSKQASDLHVYWSVPQTSPSGEGSE